MNDIHKSNLARLALGIIKPYKGHKLEMRLYISKGTVDQVRRHECGTTTCFAGYIPAVFKKEEFQYSSIEGVATRLFGINPSLIDDGPYRFLFSSLWKDDRKQCAIRALMVLRDKIPNGYSCSSNSFPEYTPKMTLKSLREELRKFIIK